MLNTFSTGHVWSGRSSNYLRAGGLQVCLHKMAQTKTSLTHRIPEFHWWCQRAALMKLLFFAATLAILPISSYFLTEKYVWSGSSSTGCSHEFVLISSSRQLQLCRDHCHMCGQHRPNSVHCRFFDGRQAIVQGSGGEETVRNQEGAINWVITLLCMSLSSTRHFQCMHSSCLYPCNQTNYRRGPDSGSLEDTGLPDIPASKRTNSLEQRVWCKLTYVIQIMMQRSTFITELTNVCRKDKRFNIKIFLQIRITSTHKTPPAINISKCHWNQ